MAAWVKLNDANPNPGSLAAEGQSYSTAGEADMEIGIYIEAQEGVTWRDWRRVARHADALEFDALVSSVHLRSLLRPGRWALDMWPVMTALALWTRHVRFGPLVLPVTFFPPAQVARLAAGLDRLSEGRFRLSLGAGRDAAEHEAFGFVFSDHDERVAMVGEAIQVIRLLWSGAPVSFAGRWFRLDQAQLQPVPEAQWIGTGGNSEATLRVAAAGADEWCTAGLLPEELRARMARLDRYAAEAGREPRAITRSVMNGVLVGRDMRELESRAKRLAGLMPEMVGLGARTILERAAAEWRWWVGTPAEVVEQVRGLRQAGADWIFFQVFDFRDLRAIELLAETVVPDLRAS